MKVLRISDAVIRKVSEGRWELGQYYQQREIADAFTALRCDVEVTVFGRLLHEPFSAEFQIEGPKWKCDGVPVVRKGVVSFLHGALRNILVMRKLLSESDVAWVILPTLTGLWALLVMPKSTRALVQLVGDPYRSTRASQSGPFKWVWTWLFDRIVRFAIRRAVAASYVSRDLRERYPAKDGAPACVAHENRIHSSMLTEIALRPPRNPQEPLRMGYVGRLEPGKGLSTLLEAVAVTQDVELALVGKGSLGLTLIKNCEELGIRERVRMMGQISWGPDLLARYRTFDVLVLPSLTEGLPLVVIEAMSQGVPIIASRVGGIPELVEHGVNGLLINPGDHEALVEAVERLRDDEELRLKMAERCWERARQETSEVVYKRTCECVVRAAYLSPSVA